MTVPQFCKQLLAQAIDLRGNVGGFRKLPLMGAGLEIVGADGHRYTVGLDAVSPPVSLCEKVFATEDDNFTLLDQLADSKVSESFWIDNVTLTQSLSKLTQREQEVINKRYFLGKTQMEISNEIGISQAQVSRIEKGALSQIRANFN